MAEARAIATERYEDPLRAQTGRVGAGLWPVLEGWRRLAEEQRINIILLAADARLSDEREEAGHAAYFTDRRVRSTLGDAARHHADVRVRVEQGPDGAPDRVVLIKDGVEGLLGRILYERLAFGDNRGFNPGG